MTWFTTEESWKDILQSVPYISEQFEAYYSSYWKLSQIPPATLELCRLRIAQLHQSRHEYAKEEVAVPPNKKANLVNWNSDESFSAAERACLELTEVYTMDCTAVTDQQAEAVKDHHGDAGLVALLQALGLFYGITRVAMLWDL